MPTLNYTDSKKTERKEEGGRYFKSLLQIWNWKGQTWNLSPQLRPRTTARSTPSFSSSHTLSWTVWMLSIIVVALLLIMCRYSLERLQTVIYQEVFNVFVIPPKGCEFFLRAPSTSLVCPQASGTVAGQGTRAQPSVHTPLRTHSPQLTGRIHVCHINSYRCSCVGIVLCLIIWLSPLIIMPREELRKKLQNNSETFSVCLAHIIRLNTECETTRDRLIHL